MVYRITIEKFLSHMIDYFKIEELTNFQYAIISAKIQNSGKCSNVSKISLDIYPPFDLVSEYGETHNDELFRKSYLDYLRGKLDKTNSNFTTPTGAATYRAIIQPLLNHNDICLICTEDENYYMDVFCEFLEKDFACEVIDLNVLFTKGKIGPISIDRDKIHDKAVDVRRAALKDMKRSYESTHDGRVKLIGMMNKKDKIKKLKELGIKSIEKDENIDQMLIDLWDEDMSSKGFN